MRRLKPIKRGAGVLLHITSLPSAFGAGDVGPEARKFADFLRRAGQKYWQLLPLTATDAAYGYSPYSSASSMAGNKRLISAEYLERDHLLSKDFLKSNLPPIGKKTIDFEKICSVSDLILEEAFKNFEDADHPKLRKQFTEFCNTESAWLNDYALYCVSKVIFGNLPWYRWPAKVKSRDKAALNKIVTDHALEIRREKWYQFIIDRQWSDLKNYCNKAGISIIGDIPFYVSHDSVDCWVHPEIFGLDSAGAMKKVAGVPPDYFNSDGQLWGMPVFDWDELKRQKYQWWIDRIKRNLELYDIVRLDHFRAFSSFWEVAAGSKTARTGKWKKGPGRQLFDVLTKKLGNLPMIAEDLGDIDHKVIDLRDEIGLPGMKVLQFGFGNDIAVTGNIPHNFTSAHAIVYTGTHDNNTTRGWFRKDLDEKSRDRVAAYVGKRMVQNNVAESMIQLAYASVADIAIIPLQDILNLDERSRMNTPASTADNWGWRFLKGALKKGDEIRLKQLATLFNRL